MNDFRGGECSITGTIRINAGQVTYSNVVVVTHEDRFSVQCRICRAEESLPSPTYMEDLMATRTRMEEVHKDCKEGTVP